MCVCVSQIWDLTDAQTNIFFCLCVFQEDISCLMTEFQHQRQKTEAQICKISHNKSRLTVGGANIYRSVVSQ